MTNNMRKAIRGRVAVVVLATLGLGGLVAQQQATKPATHTLAIHWHLETVQGQAVHVNFPAVQRETSELLARDGR